jgi:hypothetical protein
MKGTLCFKRPFISSKFMIMCELDLPSSAM